jgi:hypothetical protein
LLEKRPVVVLPPKRDGAAVAYFFTYLGSAEKKVGAGFESVGRKLETVSLGSCVKRPSGLIAPVCGWLEASFVGAFSVFGKL